LAMLMLSSEQQEESVNSITPPWVSSLSTLVGQG
jgi:hypothetical protein